MRRIILRTLVLSACIVAMNCGKSNPTSPDASTPAPGGGGSGGTGGTGATAITTDDTFSDSDWDDEVQTFGAGGTGGGGHLSFNGQAGAGPSYRQITITVNNAGSGSAAQVAVFAIKRGAVYFPPSDGAIFSIGYSESSINQSSGNGQYSAPAIRQNGKLYTLVPGGKAFSTPEPTWTDHSLTGLTQNDFRTIASAADHPDFSASGGRIEVGFMRLYTVQAGGNGGTVKGGIDNYRLTLFR